MNDSHGFFSSLRVKISIYILVGAVILSGVIIGVTSHYLNQTLTDSLISQGRIVANSIAELAAEKLIEEDVVGMKKIMEKYRYYVSNQYILIVDPTYKVVTDTYNGNIPPELSNETVYTNFDFSSGKEYEVTTMNVQGSEVYDILLPVKEGLLGFVRVGLKKSLIEEQVQTTIFYIGGIIALGTLAAIVIALMVITVQVTRPVAHLAKAAQEISLGNFNTPVEIKVKNELQTLAASIDRMKESLKTSLERLKTRSTVGRF
jgi:HAMP domain-containing protein